MSKSIRDRLVGAWEMIEYCAHLPDDESNKKYPMGQEAQGILMYTADGCMSAQILTPGQDRFEFPGSSEDWIQVGKRYAAYSGPFEINESGDGEGPFALHHVRVASWPMLIGETQKRFIRFVDIDNEEHLELSLKTHDVFREGRWTRVRWRRLAKRQ